jgi:hypothetical protein
MVHPPRTDTGQNFFVILDQPEQQLGVEQVREYLLHLIRDHKDEAEQFRHNRVASVATLRNLFAFGPECRSRSLRNQRSPSPESARLPI